MDIFWQDPQQRNTVILVRMKKTSQTMPTASSACATAYWKATNGKLRSNSLKRSSALFSKIPVCEMNGCAKGFAYHQFVIQQAACKLFQNTMPVSKRKSRVFSF
jgi:hypothetical protein